MFSRLQSLIAPALAAELLLLSPSSATALSLKPSGRSSRRASRVTNPWAAAEVATTAGPPQAPAQSKSVIKMGGVRQAPTSAPHPVHAAGVGASGATAADCHSEGNRLFREGDHAAACEMYGRALAALASAGSNAAGSSADGGSRLVTEQPSVSAVLCNRSSVLLKLARAEDALADAARAVSIDPGSIKPRYRQACALQALGRHREARDAYDAGLLLSPEHAQLSELRRACEASIRSDKRPPGRRLPLWD